MEKTIVLLHGFGEDHHIFDNQLSALREQYHVLAPDLPGSGTRVHHSWEAAHESMEWMAGWLKAWLDKEQIDQCILLGHSMGGYITLAFAEQYPERLKAFGLIHSTAFADSDAKRETRRKAITFMEEKGAHTFLKTAIPGLFGQSFASEHPASIAQLVEKAKVFPLQSLAAYYRAMLARPDRSGVLKNAKVPVLLIAGAEDSAVPLADLLQQASMPSVCYFHNLPMVGHMGMLEAPDTLNRILLNFIKDV